MSANKKKIFDIIPPEGSSKRHKPSLPIELEKPIKLEGAGKESRVVKEFIFQPKVFSRRAVAITGALILLIILSFGAYIKLLEARVTIWPVQETWEFQEEVLVTTSTRDIDVGAERIPGRITEDVYEVFRQFDASGEASQEVKAKGTIRVYNKYNLAQVLVATTRFLSSDGKLFRSIARVSIPSGSYQDVEVEAAEPGEEYNIGPSIFSIPGLAGTSRYTVVYGESLTPMTGGTVSRVSQVTEEDIRKAKDAVSRAITEEGKKKLLDNIDSKKTIFLDAALSQDVVEVKSLVSAGTAAQNFQIQSKVVSRVLVFEHSDLDRFVREFIATQFSPEKKINEASLKISFVPSQMRWEEESLVLVVSASANLYKDPNMHNIRRSLSGKDVREAKDILKQKQEVAKFKIEFWPLPVGNIPKNIEKIKVEIQF